TRLPVRSALDKQRTGGLVVRWVTTGEYRLLNVFGNFLASRDFIWISRTKNDCRFAEMAFHGQGQRLRQCKIATVHVQDTIKSI
ncbi:hypothetical protein EK21DRAFT_82739, partial [Setomelanomma holmii]